MSPSGPWAPMPFLWHDKLWCVGLLILLPAEGSNETRAALLEAALSSSGTHRPSRAAARACGRQQPYTWRRSTWACPRLELGHGTRLGRGTRRLVLGNSRGGASSGVRRCAIRRRYGARCQRLAARWRRCGLRFRCAARRRRSACRRSHCESFPSGDCRPNCAGPRGCAKSRNRAGPRGCAKSRNRAGPQGCAKPRNRAGPRYCAERIEFRGTLRTTGQRPACD